MRKLLLAMFLSIGCQLSNSQSAKKVIINTPLSLDLPRIIPGDIAYSGNFSGSEGKIIGYSYKSSGLTYPIGMINIADNGTILFSRNYVTSNRLEIRKVSPLHSNYSTGPVYVLSRLETTPSQFMPAIIEINNSTGSIVSQYVLNIPNNEAVFYASDIMVNYEQNPTNILILCGGFNLNAPAGVNKSSLYLVDFNLSTLTFSTTKIYNAANINEFFDIDVYFIKQFYNGQEMLGNLAFYGKTTTGSLNDKGFVFSRDYNNVDRCKYFALNGGSTRAIQVNVPFAWQQTIAIQNTVGQIYLESNEFLSNILWQKRYNRNFPLFYLHGSGHFTKGIDQGTGANADYFLGQFRENSSGASTGFSFFRYNHTNGNLRQTYNYDANINLAGTIVNLSSSYYSYLTQKYYFIGNCKTMSTLPFKYFYLIENVLEQDQTNCVYIPSFTEENYPVVRTDVPLTFNTYSTNVPATPLNLTELINPVPTIEPICGDIEGREGIEQSTDSSIQEILKGYLEKAVSEGGEGLRLISSNINTAQQDKVVVFTSSTKRILFANIYNPIGQLTKRIPSNYNLGKKFQINFNELKGGPVYIVELVLEDGTKETKKIIL